MKRKVLFVFALIMMAIFALSCRNPANHAAVDNEIPVESDNSGPGVPNDTGTGEPTNPDGTEDNTSDNERPAAPDDDGSGEPTGPDDGLQAPRLYINELRTEFQRASFRVEYIEFKMLSEGNLGGLRVFAASNNKTPMIYEFKPVEVQAGEYVVLHLRTMEEDSCKNEYGESLDESGGTDSSPTARDFWIPESTKLLRKTDAVYVMDQAGHVMDAVMIAEKPDSEWSGPLAEAAVFLFNQGAWKSRTGTIPVPADAVNSSGIGQILTRSISRIETTENTCTAADWYVTGSNGATPGKPNI